MNDARRTVIIEDAVDAISLIDEMTEKCPDCSCPKGLHTKEAGCVCEDDDGHKDTLAGPDGETFCTCLRSFDCSPERD